MNNSLALFLSVLFICISILALKKETWELQEQQEKLKNEIIELKEFIDIEQFKKVVLEK